LIHHESSYLPFRVSYRLAKAVILSKGIVIMAYRSATKHQGVYERKSQTRVFNGKPDMCFDIAYRADGKLVWEKVGWASEGYTAKLAVQIRSERLRNIRHGQDLPKHRKKAPLFKEVAEKYLAWASENKTRRGQDDIYRYKKYLAGRLDQKRLDEIHSFDLERVKSELAKEDLSPASVKHCLVLVRQMFNKAVSWGLYSGENPIKGVKLPLLQNQRQRFLSHAEADLLLTELNKSSRQLHDIALVGLHCGLRAGEIFNLKGQDLDFEHEVINVSDPKNRESRQAFMTQAVKSMLSARIPHSPNAYVFEDRTGKKIVAVSQAFRRAVDRLKFNEGITDPRQLMTFHSLRHTFASWLALQGETLLTIKELLGHKTLVMTQRYAHLIPDHKRRAALNLEVTFNEKRNGASGVIDSQ
jgi:integrase